MIGINKDKLEEYFEEETKLKKMVRLLNNMDKSKRKNKSWYDRSYEE